MKKEILSRLSYFRACEGNVGNYTPFVSYKMTTFWLALPSWLLKVPNFCFDAFNPLEKADFVESYLLDHIVLAIYVTLTIILR